MSKAMLERYEAGRLAFVADPSDNPECVPYYACHAGLRAAWGDARTKALSHAGHEIMNAARHGGLPSAIECVRAYLSPVTTEPPVRWYSYSACPEAVFTADSVFRSEFKRAYPGERVNGKKAKELRTPARMAKAQELADRKNASLREEWEAEERRRSEAWARTWSRWMDSIHEAALIADAAWEIVREWDAGE